MRLLLSSDTIYPHPGEVAFADVAVDPTTGSISLRALFPNPDAALLPSMFVRARVEEGTMPEALLVPQRGITRDRQGRATTLVVDEKGRVELREVSADRAVGDDWLVTSGLAPGDRVIVEGLQKVQPGIDVVVVPLEARQAAR